MFIYFLQDVHWKNLSDNMKAKLLNEENNELLNSSPPPLPPRSSHSSEDISPTSVKQMSVECNGDLIYPDHVITQQLKQESLLDSEHNEVSECVAIAGSSDKQPLDEESSRKSHTPSTSERYITVYLLCKLVLHTEKVILIFC